ncbi:hypothetical protein PAE0133 [Pyrobaculum aerophilum str. IM2]|uniref:Uncharacterized protein n=2 Tax=Pyrobaculum aerophilum TaxID=13773 RepID=Q8ZZQ6_PYRAE|nr:hypothetical protein [Pyrobaculum aerophilum]AAL62583.1 hypothetical protein PAE0133 [Pyrobaculum aerophilum str. IM2]HII46799.1 hypothetical protein [Pyrobaculum aerophilum]
MVPPEKALNPAVLELLKVSMALEVAFGLVSLTWVLAVVSSLAYILSFFFTPLAGAVVLIIAAVYITLGYSTVFAAYRIIKNPASLKPSESLFWSKLALVASALSFLGGNVLYGTSSALMALSLYLYTKERAAKSYELRIPKAINVG